MRTDELQRARALIAAVRADTAARQASLAWRLVQALRAGGGADEWRDIGPALDAVAAWAQGASAAGSAPDGTAAAHEPHPLDRLARWARATEAFEAAEPDPSPGAAPALVSPVAPFAPLAQAAGGHDGAADPAHGPLCDLVLLASLPEAHEACAALCRALHPQAQPWATPALALRVLAPPQPGQAQALREAVQGLLCSPPAPLAGLFMLGGDGPWHSRSLRLDAGVAAALQARAPQPGQGRLVTGPGSTPGLAGWLAEPAARQAVAALRAGWPCRIVLLGGDAALRASRMRALLGAAQAVALRCDDNPAPAPDDPRSATEQLGAALLVAQLHRAALWLAHGDDELAPGAPGLAAARGHIDPGALAWPLPVLQSARLEHELLALPLPLLRVPAAPLAPAARRALWRGLLPQLGEAAGPLAARYPIEPDDAQAVVRDLALRQVLLQAPLAVEAVGECIRERTPWQARPGVQRLQPRAGWPQLHLPAPVNAQLHAAVQRVAQQLTVLDDWGYAPGPGGRRGVRLLFCGAPGTGKTLAAEVMARELGVHLLVVDLASLVSKWIGETEKNLGAVFDAAERARALLLFDEADALFGRRSEGTEANDRHANLETAYLLQRLEAFEGVAVLTTNLRAHLDAAFTRRFEFIVEFPEPDAAARAALWRLHLPPQAPLGADVDLGELAAWYALTGAQIRNAALGAAFAAAAEGQVPRQRHFLRAVEREYDKAGRAHPGFPPHTDPADAADPAAPHRF